VLDAACGEGYGSFLLSQTAKEVVGVDIAAKAIAHARSRYVAPNLRYVEGSCTALPLANASVDLIVSFETIEHLQQQAEMLAEFRRVLVPTGTLVISSPNQSVYSDELQGRNEYHVRELTREELVALLTPIFPQQQWYGQRIVAHSAMWAQPTKGEASGESSLLGLVDDEVRVQTEPRPPMYFIVVCGAKTVRLPSLPALSLFDDGKQSLYRDYNRALLREKELFWQELDARRIAEDRLSELITVTNDFASARQKMAALENRIAPLEDAFDKSQAELNAQREFTNALTWEERNARSIAEARLAELITLVNNLASEREKSAALTSQVESLQGVCASVRAELEAESQKVASLEWEERDMRKVAEERLTQLIAAVNALSTERDNAATLGKRVSSLDEAYAAAQAELASERQKVVGLEWDERELRRIGDERLSQLITAVNDLGSEREKTSVLGKRVSALEEACAAAQAELASERQKVVGLEWDGRELRRIGDERLGQLITAVNDLNSEREKTTVLLGRVTSLEAAYSGSQRELAAEREVWSAQLAAMREASSAELASVRAELEASIVQLDVTRADFARLAEELANRDAELANRVAELANRDAELASRDAELANRAEELADRDAELANRAEELEARLTALTSARTELGTAVSELATIRDQFSRTLLELTVARADLTGTKDDLAAARTEVLRHDNTLAELAEVRSRLRFRETLIGWLRWPLARLKSSIRPTG
jgi:DNA repair exonuclease SbcCD ATPase subunit